MTLVAAGRDVLRVVAAQEGSDYEDDLRPVIGETDDLSQPLGEVWTGGLPAYRGYGAYSPVRRPRRGTRLRRGRPHEPSGVSLVAAPAVVGAIPRPSPSPAWSWPLVPRAPPLTESYWGTDPRTG